MGHRDAAPLRALMRMLNRNDRLILMLTYAEKLTVGEIAATLDLTESHVETSLDRLRERARMAMGVNSVAV